jgi:MSHA biogenesis protein MshG
MNKISNFFKKSKNPRKIIYGVTDTRNDPFLEKVNNFLIDHSLISKKEKMMFFNSLRLLVTSGVTFTKAIKMLSIRSKNKLLKRILDTIEYDMLNSGMRFSDAMAKYPRVFSSSEIKMIYSGELSGRLEEVLDSVATRIQKNIEMDIRVKSALMYPITVFVAIILAGIVVMVFVVPKFEAMFLQFGSDLPIATRIMIGTSNFIRDSWWFVLLLFVSGWIVFQNWKNSEKGKLEWDKFLLDLPGIGILIRDIQTAKIAGNFSTLLISGIPITKALHVLGEIIDNSLISKSLLIIEQEVRQGKQVFESFARQTPLDPILAEVIEIGEKSGSIPEVLRKVGMQYDLEVDAQLKNLSSMIEPIVILIVGAAVSFMALAIMTPIMKMQSLFTG